MTCRLVLPILDAGLMGESSSMEAGTVEMEGHTSHKLLSCTDEATRGGVTELPELILVMGMTPEAVLLKRQQLISR